MIHSSNSNRLLVDRHDLSNIYHRTKPKALSVYFKSKQILLLALQSGIGLPSKEYRYTM